jgi:hypothetical protein
MNAAGSILALLLGAAAWLVPSAITGKAEAWDDPIYFQAALPALAVAVFALGIAFPIRAWRWGPLAMAGQALALLLANPSGDLSLLPVGIILMALISIPLALLSGLGSLLTRRGRDALRAGRDPASRDSR